MNPVLTEDPDEIGVLLDRAIHDLRSPLRKVRVAADFLNESASENPKAKMWVEQILSGTTGIDKILSALVQYSLSQRLSAYTFSRVSTEAALLSAIASLQDEIQSRNAEIVYENLPHTEGDLDRLADLFRHLIEN